MRTRWSLAAAALVAVAALGPGFAAEGEGKKATVADLAWMTGSWCSEHGGDRYEEHWLPPAGGSMAAVFRAVEGGKPDMYEISAVETGEDGRPVLRIRHFGPGLVPWKSEAEKTPSWPLASTAKDEAVFEDPAADFPRRIVYRLADASTLAVKLEPAPGSKRQPMEFRLKKVR
jgi:hypothetical protein